MGYTKYHTEGIVLRSFNIGSSDCSYKILTKNMGLVYARAKSVRKLHSKLRFGLQEMSCVDVSLVKARNSWRVTNAIPKDNFYRRVSDNHLKTKTLMRVSKLLLRLLQGEEVNERLYDVVYNGVRFIAGMDSYDEHVYNLEVLLVLRTLKELGYIAGGGRFGYMLSSPFVNDMILYEAGRNRPFAIREINRALKETQL